MKLTIGTEARGYATIPFVPQVGQSYVFTARDNHDTGVYYSRVTVDVTAVSGAIVTGRSDQGDVVTINTVTESLTFDVMGHTQVRAITGATTAPTGQAAREQQQRADSDYWRGEADRRFRRSISARPR